MTPVTSTKGTILIVDDTPANLSVLSSILTEQGYDVRAVINGAMALTAVQVDRPDLILLDVRMPNMDGYEVCQHLRANRDMDNVPILFISASDEVLDKVKAFQSGGVDYITKPFQVEEVLARVETQLMVYRQRREIETLLQQGLIYFENLSRMKDQFLSMASHDLKNPITVVMAYAELLLDNPNASLSDPKVRAQLGRIHSAAKQMQSLVSDLLDLARIETGLALNLESVPLTPFLSHCVENFELLAQQKNIQLRFSPSAGDIVLQIDPMRMEQVLNNLLSNALKYTPPGKHVEVTTQVEDTYIIIHVTDAGLGIPDKDIPHLFERFYRVNREEHLIVEGTGLGLAIVKSLVEQHHGEIRVQSEMGKGSVFSVVLPFQDPSFR